MIAMCAICFKDKVECQPISYPHIVEAFELRRLKPVAIACCEECFHGDPEELHQSVADYIIIDQIAAFKSGYRKGLIRYEFEYAEWVDEAIKNGVFEREQARQAKAGVVLEIPIQTFNFEKKSDFHTELILKAMFKKHV